MRRLRPRRHGSLVAGPWTRGAVAEGKNGIVTRGLQSGPHDQLIDRLVSSPAMSFSRSAALMPAAQTTSSAGIEVPFVEIDAVRSHFHDPRAGVHPHLRSSSSSVAAFERRSGNAGRIRGAASIRCDLDVLVGIDAVQAKGHELARRLVQLRRQLGAGRAGADDRHLQLLRPQRLGL